ncbi:MAG: ribose 5-phosphate isomerase B [Anaerolineae bacterium]
MRVAIGCDHGGYALKQVIVDYLQANAHHVVDFGAFSLNPEDDYPDFVVPAAAAVQRGEADRAIVLCGSAVGAAVAANKLKGIRAAICHDTYSAHQGVEHDNMNVLALGARVVGSELALELVAAFMHAQFTGEARHLRRLEKVAAVEQSELI